MYTLGAIGTITYRYGELEFTKYDFLLKKRSDGTGRQTRSRGQERRYGWEAHG